ncbi:MAG: hypothetical protein SGI96_15750 [Bacteroidota bacterium]|nr:hypothetical protein [Bacteroidota bacterium]
MDKIAITSDVEWAPEPVIKYMISLFEERNVKCTFFCTHYSEVLLNANKQLFELAIHPNFNPLLQGQAGTSEKIIDNLLSIYPMAKGVRSHSMLQSTGLLSQFAQKGLIYESNHFLPYHTNVSPFLLWNGMVRLPYVWEDDVHWLYGNSFDDLKINIELSGLKILDFHPIHIYLNTVNEDHYLSAKQFYQQPVELAKLRNDGAIKKGAKDALEKLFREIETNELQTFFLHEIATEFKNNN